MLGKAETTQLPSLYESIKKGAHTLLFSKNHIKDYYLFFCPQVEIKQ